MMTSVRGFDPWLNGEWARLEAKMSAQCHRIGERIPYIPGNGEYAVAIYRLTGNPMLKARGVHAANLLAGCYNP